MDDKGGKGLSDYWGISLFKETRISSYGITALFSAVALLFFALPVKKHRIGSPFWAGLMLAFSPYISSTTTMDYTWAMAFVMVSYYLLSKTENTGFPHCSFGRQMLAGLPQRICRSRSQL